MGVRPTQSREGVKGGTSSLFVCPLRGQGAELPCGVWGNAPTVSRATNSKEAPNKGAGSEASLPLTSRSRRSAPKLLYPLLAHCRAKWARPRCMISDHSWSFPQAGDFASAEATRGQWKQTKSAVAPPLTPSALPLFWGYLRLVFDCFGKICVKLASLNFFLPHQAGIFACNREISFSTP